MNNVQAQTPMNILRGVYDTYHPTTFISGSRIPTSSRKSKLRFATVVPPQDMALTAIEYKPYIILV